MSIESIGPTPILGLRGGFDTTYRHYSIRVQEAYIGWIRRFILFHNKKHPKDMGQKEVEAFLTYLALEGKGQKDRITVLPDEVKTSLI